MKKVLVPGLATGLALLIVSMILSPLFNIIYPGLMAEYQNPALFRPWADPLMQLYFVYPFILGLAFAWVWDKTKNVISGRGLSKALNFTVAVFVISTFPGMWITYSSFQVSLAMVLTWTAMGLVDAFVAGVVLNKLNG